MNLHHREILQRYFPEETIDHVSESLTRYSIQLTITRGRVSKLGDYRPPVRSKLHRISINGNLDKTFFYLVFIHELAHLLVWQKYQRKVAPHGRQWKEEFSALLRQAIFLGHLPEHLKQPIYDFSRNVKATFASDPVLSRILKQHDAGREGEITIADIPVDSYFVAENGKLFYKIEKLRKRFRCYCIDNKKRYLFQPTAVVKPVETPVHNYKR